MNPYNFSMVFFASCTFTMSLIIWLKRRDRVAKFYLYFCTNVAIWASLWAVMISENISYESALLCSRVSHSIGGLVGISWFHFCLLVSGEYIKYRKLLALFYLIAFISVLFIFTPYFVPEVVPIMSFKHYTKTGPILDLYMVIFVLSIGFGFMTLDHKIRVSSGQEKNQIRGLFISTVIGFIGGFCTILPIYGVNLKPYTVFMIPIYPFVMAYFMMRHRLFDLDAIAQLFQREKLATIGLLAASVNHEIRNPLYAARSILENYSEALKEGRPVVNPEEVIGKLKTQIERTLDIITKLNRFAKPAGETSTDQRCSIQEATRNILDLVSYEFSLDKIKINNQIPDNLPQIRVDQRQLEEILFNLIVNACHAMEGGGELVIAADGHCEAASQLKPKQSQTMSFPRKRESRDVDSRQIYSGMTKDFVRITIQDTGPGISSEQAKYLFEPFHTTKGDKGTGLGLYITKQLVERNGGKISVSSKPSQGTSFTLEFKS